MHKVLGTRLLVFTNDMLPPVEDKELGQHRTEQRSAIWPKEWYNLCMDKPITMSAFSDELANVRTKKKEFLAQIDRIVPWGEWVAEIKP